MMLANVIWSEVLVLPSWGFMRRKTLASSKPCSAPLVAFGSLFVRLKTVLDQLSMQLKRYVISRFLYFILI